MANAPFFIVVKPDSAAAPQRQRPMRSAGALHNQIFLIVRRDRVSRTTPQQSQPAKNRTIQKGQNPMRRHFPFKSRLLLRQLALVACIIAMNVIGPGATSAADLPGGTSEDAEMAIKHSDNYAWKLFLAINLQGDPKNPGLPSPGAAISRYDDDKPVVWETWALASGGRNGGPIVNPANNYSEVFLNDGKKPLEWGAWPRTEGLKRFESLPAQSIEMLRESLANQSLKSLDDVRKLHPQFVPVADLAEGDEVRMNRGTYDFVRDNELYNVEGLEAQFKAENAQRREDRKPPLSFPANAQEIKAQWRIIQNSEKNKYHWRTLTTPAGDKVVYGLVALHIITKDLPNWFWCDFVHVNYDNQSEIAGVDSTPGNEDGSHPGTEGTKWATYRLRGSQVAFTDARGRATIVANPLIEKGFQQTSSCITCHARATVGLRAVDEPTQFRRLRTFIAGDLAPPSVQGAIGTPDPKWYLDSNNSVQFSQTDFLWSLPFRALSTSTKPPAAPESQAPQRNK